MVARLADRLSAARRSRFVGRAAERELFLSCLTSAELPFQILFVFGPGGVGKTTLLAEFSATCADSNVPVVSIDARNIEPSADSLLEALGLGLGVAHGESPVEALAARPGPQVVLIDTYEMLSALDGWLRERLLPEMPGHVLFVLAGRDPPSAPWRADPGWQTLLRVVPLRNLSPDESRAYLAERNVPADQHEAVLGFTHGHPLAVSLVADSYAQRRDLQFRPEAAPDIVKALLEHFVEKVPAPAHRSALEACALVRLTTETLLSELLGEPEVNELFAWLRGLSFIEAGPVGLFPHDLAREALSADLRWRNPDRYRELHHRARAYYHRALQQTTGQAQQRVLIDFIYLHRDSPIIRPFIEVQAGSEGESLLPEAARVEDHQPLVAMARQHEGDESAALLARYLACQPEGIVVIRGPTGEPAGFLAMVAMERLDDEERSRDPAIRAAWSYLERHGPLRAGERATMFRFWMAGDTYQSVSSAQRMIFVAMVRHYLVTPGVAFTFLPCATPALWASMFTYADLARIEEADFEVGGRRYAAYGHDWRAVPPTAWLALLAERETATTSVSAQPQAPELLVVLSHPEFIGAVQHAIRHVSEPDALLGNPLLRSRVVLERAGPRASAPQRIAALQILLKEALDAVSLSPTGAKLAGAVRQTWLQPKATQEQAAELLDLPFSTYRRHLRSGMEQVGQTLWQRELQGPMS